MARFAAPLIALITILPVLAGCGSDAPAGPPPVPPEALAAVIAKPGVNREKLARAADRLFTDEALGETRALVVMRNGTILAERYAPGLHENTRFVSWSMAKTVTGVMIGMLVADGRLRLDESVPIPAWQRPGDPRGEITLRQLLQMRSGLRHSEMGNPIYRSDEVRALFLDGRDNMAAYAESQPLEAEPGAKFEYSTNTTLILADIAARVLAPNGDAEARRRAVYGYLHSRLFEPAGMTSALPEFDAHGTLVGGSLIHANARDWARFGEFLRTGGSVKGAQLVPRKWIEFMTRPSPRNAAYGAQTWLNREPSGGNNAALLAPRGRETMFAAVGHLGQYVLVSPQQGLTVARLGNSDSEQREVLKSALADLIEQFPDR